MEFIKNQNWRYATKKFNSNKTISAEDLELLKKAIQLSVSSYGLQLYKVIIIKDKTLREQLRIASWNQSQITEASHLFVFCNYTEVNPINIEEYIKQVSLIRNVPISELERYADFMKIKLLEKSKEEQFNWSKHQTYIALANLLSACAELKIDACPMEGFGQEQYNKILGLTEQGLNASVIATVGYRDEEDKTQFLKKVRKPFEQLFEEI